MVFVPHSSNESQKACFRMHTRCLWVCFCPLISSVVSHLDGYWYRMPVVTFFLIHPPRRFSVVTGQSKNRQYLIYRLAESSISSKLYMYKILQVAMSSIVQLKITPGHPVRNTSLGKLFSQQNSAKTFQVATVVTRLEHRVFVH